MRVVTSNSAPAGRRIPGNPRDAAARAAIEKAFSRAIPLVCGHITYLEIDLAYSLWRPRGRGVKRQSYCEQCEHFRLIKWPEKTKDVEPEPLF